MTEKNQEGEVYEMKKLISNSLRHQNFHEMENVKNNTIFELVSMEWHELSVYKLIPYRPQVLYRV